MDIKMLKFDFYHPKNLNKNIYAYEDKWIIGINGIHTYLEYSTRKNINVAAWSGPQ
jgi:hypothetical protein